MGRTRLEDDGGTGVKGGEIILTPGIVKPIHIAVSLENSWLFDNMQYEDLAEWLNHWDTAGDGSSIYAFVKSLHEIQGTTPALNGDTAQAVNLYRFRAPAALVDDVFFCRIKFNRATGGFFFLGFVTGDIEGALATAQRLDQMADSFAFFTDGGNWQAMTQDGSSAGERTVTDTGVTPIGVQEFEIRMTAVAIEFYIAGVLVATHTTDIALGSNALFVKAGVSAINSVARSFGLVSVSAGSDREF